MIEAIVTAMVVLPIGAAIGRSLVSKPPPPTVPIPEPLCTGYRAYLIEEGGKRTNRYHSLTDCKGLRSPTCLDGRCSLHCRETCKCDASNDPEHIGRRR